MKRKLTTLLLALLAMVPALADDLSLGYCDGQQVDEYAFNNTLSAPLRVLSEIVRRKVLVEEFTGQQCSNCPAGRTNIEEGMKDEDHYVMIAHHTGYGTDALTAPGTTKLNWFYNSSTTYAPDLMIDRKDLSAYGVSKNGNTNPTPVFVVPQAALVKAIYQWESTQAAPVSIALKRSYDATTRQLTVLVGMKQVEGQTIGNNPALTLCIIENNIVAYQYPEGDNYVHQKANRAFLTQALGGTVSLSTDAPPTPPTPPRSTPLGSPRTWRSWPSWPTTMEPTAPTARCITPRGARLRATMWWTASAHRRWLPLLRYRPCTACRALVLARCAVASTL